jgi:ATP-dependent DNA helicase RecG
VTTVEEFRLLLDTPQRSRAGSKAPPRRFSFDDLARYCVARANESGAEIAVGVTDKRARRVVGTTAFPEPGRPEAGLRGRLRHAIRLEGSKHDGKRVLIVYVPSRLRPRAWHERGTFWMGAGDAHLPVSDGRLR